MSNQSLKKNAIMVAIIISSFALYGNVQAEEYNNGATEVHPEISAKTAPGDTKVPVVVYKESLGGDLKDGSNGNNGLVSIASISDSQLNQEGIFTATENGQGEVK